MNNIVANLLLSLTSSARFEGSLNMDLNEISMNLVPFPQLHYLVSSLTPLYTLADVSIPPRRLKPALHFVSWNQEGWKTSLCSVPPVGHSHSLLALANNTCVKPTFMELRERFMRLYKKKAHLHHYLQVDGMEECAFAEAVSSLSALIEEYNELDATKSMPVLDVPRLSVALWKKQLNMHCFFLWPHSFSPLSFNVCDSESPVCFSQYQEVRKCVI